MQSAALVALGLGEEWSYGALDLSPEEFEARVRALPEEGFAGANVTVPHKQAAMLTSRASEMRPTSCAGLPSTCIPAMRAAMVTIVAVNSQRQIAAIT